MSDANVRTWRASPSAGTLLGAVALFAVVAAAATIGWRVVPTLDGRVALVAGWLAVALLIVAALGLIGLLWGLLTLSYSLVSGAAGQELVIRWAWTRVRIPLVGIEYFGLARHIVRPTRSRRSWPWPGYYLSSVYDESLGRIATYATLPLRRQLVICSTVGVFGISPDRPADMMAAFAVARRGATPADAWSLPGDAQQAAAASAPAIAPSLRVDARDREIDKDGASAPSLVRDRLTVALVLTGGVFLVLMVWFIVLRFDRVPDALPLHYSATGQPDRIGTPREIFILPLIAALAALANVALAWSVIRYDAFAARLFTGGTLLVQLVAWVALLKLF